MNLINSFINQAYLIPFGVTGKILSAVKQRYKEQFSSEFEHYKSKSVSKITFM